MSGQVRIQHETADARGTQQTDRAQRRDSFMTATRLFAPTASVHRARYGVGPGAVPLACLVLQFILLAACSGGSSDDGPPAPEPPAPPSEQAYRVGGVVSGLDGTSRTLRLEVFEAGGGGATQSEDLSVQDGPFLFAMLVPDGYEWRLRPDNPPGDPLYCDVMTASAGNISGADVTDAEVRCDTAYYVSGTVDGLDNVPKSELDGIDLRNLTARFDVGDLETLKENGPFRFNLPLWDGEQYNVVVDEQPRNPVQKCVVRNGTGSIAAADVTNVEVACGDATVSYTVTGLLGSGLIVGLSREVENNGNVQMSLVERNERTANGEYTFDTLLDFGEPYEVSVYQHPADPDQECRVINGTGTIEGDVVDVEVRCPQPLRYYSFEDTHTRSNPEIAPREAGSQAGGMLYREHEFDRGPAGPLGSFSDIGATELFAQLIDEPGGNAAVYSNESGETYWLAVESPPGVNQLATPEDTYYNQAHYAALDTMWRYRKVSSNTQFRLEVTKINLYAFDDTHWVGAGWPGALQAGATLEVRAHRVREGQIDPEAFYMAHGDVVLTGMRSQFDPNETEWRLERLVDSEADFDLWSDAAFRINPDFGHATFDVAYVELLNTIPIEIDLTNLAVGEDFFVIAKALVKTNNSYTNEGGSVAFLRDPGAFEPGVSPGGVALVATEGVVMVEVEEVPLDIVRAGTSGTAPQECTDAGSERSVLAFDAASYRVTENHEAVAGLVRVTRTGSLEGLVTARVRLAGGSAVSGEDFDDEELVIRFGDGSSTPRTLALPIVDDVEIESEEMLTVELIDPEGCADIGAQASAQVTIVDDDNRPGAIAFSNADFQVDESAGVATIQIVRTGGQLGVLTATLETSDATARASEGDYTAVLTTITFADGETGPLEIQVPIGDDLLSEPDETFAVTLSSLTSQINSTATTTVTIVDNDQNQANTVQFAAAQLAAVETHGRATITITRHGDTSGPASVTLTTNDGTATAGQDYEALSTTVEFAAGQAAREVELVIVSDAAPEADETVNLTLSAPSGVALGMPATAELTITEEDATAWGSWQSDVEIDAAAGVANDAQIAFDSDGNAIAMWYQETGNHTDIWSNYYEPGVGWGSAVLVEANDADRYAGAPRVAFDEQGNALAVWVQTDAVTGNESAWSNRFTPGTGWGVPERIESGADAVSGSVELAVSGNGDAIAVWTQFDGAQANIYANRYVAGSGWLGAEALNEQNEIVSNAHVAMSQDGDALVVWQQAPTGVTWNIRARRFTQSNWAPSELVSTTNTGSATSPRASFDSEGGAMVIWLQNPGFDRSVYATRHTQQGGWETPQLIGEGDRADHPRLATGPAGSAIAVWQRPVTVNGNAVITTFANRYTPANGWTGAEAISTGNVFYPKVAISSDGNALAAWFELDAGSYSIWSNRYTLDIGWRFPEQIGSSGGLIGTLMPELAFGPQGEAFAIWTRGGEVRVNNFRLAVLDAQ